MLALRRAVVLAAVCGAVLAVSACSPAASRPTPSPTTPVALTDAEAFAAAEETYRAYVEALNNVDLADPATFEPVFALTTGDVYSADSTNLTRYHSEGAVIDGDTKVVSVSPGGREDDTATIYVCIDVSEVSVSAADGSNLVSPDRPSIQALQVDMTGIGGLGEGRVAQISTTDQTC